jgi:hypothetical protein
MREQLALGSAVGAVVSLLCWIGNPTPHTNSTFPDGLTFVVLLTLLVAALWLNQRLRATDRHAVRRAGVFIGAAAGVVFATFVGILGIVRFTRPAPMLLAFGFMTAFLSNIILGVAAVELVTRLATRRNRVPRGSA